eukprot:TRINITY_DN9754_c0_g1_i3.p1 TRINITY_DN9754_c0_g1~~TRINITY_DN9754_c0_g1_i3.p1  ORF type:complete len:416 (-),score=80.94 TRINITY_DN9754_c0_g1_i3:212-1459(-)
MLLHEPCLLVVYALRVLRKVFLQSIEEVSHYLLLLWLLQAKCRRITCSCCGCSKPNAGGSPGGDEEQGEDPKEEKPGGDEEQEQRKQRKQRKCCCMSLACWLCMPCACFGYCKKSQGEDPKGDNPEGPDGPKKQRRCCCMQIWDSFAKCIVLCMSPFIQCGRCLCMPFIPLARRIIACCTALICLPVSCCKAICACFQKCLAGFFYSLCGCCFKNSNAPGCLCIFPCLCCGFGVALPYSCCGIGWPIRSRCFPGCFKMAKDEKEYLREGGKIPRSLWTPLALPITMVGKLLALPIALIKFLVLLPFQIIALPLKLLKASCFCRKRKGNKNEQSSKANEPAEASLPQLLGGQARNQLDDGDKKTGDDAVQLASADGSGCDGDSEPIEASKAQDADTASVPAQVAMDQPSADASQSV